MARAVRGGGELPVIDAYRTLSFPDDAPERARASGSTRCCRVRPRATPKACLLDLCGRVHAAVSYRRRPEKGVQTPLHTLRVGSGSCRDMATLLMDAARLLGVASRFASGYLHGEASLAARAVDARVDRGLLAGARLARLRSDHGKAIGLQHVATGVSQHPRGVMPVTGTFTGLRSLFQSLDVESQAGIAKWTA